MDDLIYEELKGTGNLEIHLDRDIANRRIFPAIDVEKSGTRHDELLYDKAVLPKINTLRRMFSLLNIEERITKMITQLTKTKTNAEFLESMNKGA